MRVSSKVSAFLFISAILISGANSSSAGMIPDDGILNFKVVRDGETIGSHVLSFRRADDRIDVVMISPHRVVRFKC